MADDWFDIKKIKLYMKKAADGPVPFAFGVGAKPPESQLAMHPKRQPDILAKALKKEGFKPTRILIGAAETKGSLLTVTCEAEVPQAKKAIKFFLKANKMLQKEVQLIGPNGAFDTDEDEEGDETSAAMAAQDEAAPDPRLETLKATIKELAEQIGNIADPEVQAKMAGALKKIAGAVNRGDADTAEPSLEKLQTMVARLAGAPTSDDTTSSAPDGWAAIATKIEPQVIAALKADHPEAQKIRAIWAFAQEKAEADDINTALKAVKKLTPLLAADVAPASSDGSKVLFEKTHLEWNAQKEQVKAKLDLLHEAILEESQEAESMTAAGKLKKVLGNFNEGLGDTLDELRNTDSTDKRELLSKKAQAIADRYMSYLASDPLVAHVDANPFDINVEAAVRLAKPLRLLQQQLNQNA